MDHDRGHCGTVAATSMHGIVEAQHDPSFKEILNSTDAIVPGGMPLVWLGRNSCCHLPRRVQFAESLKRRFAGIQVSGAFSPPFRALLPEEDEEIVTMTSRAAPNVLWVGLGTLTQERWMHEHRDKLGVRVLVSAGAAFDMLSGRRKQAPRWMRECGLECLFRLLQEPRRLWRRYLIYGAQFIAYLGLESLRRKKAALAEQFATAASKPTSPTRTIRLGLCHSRLQSADALLKRPILLPAKHRGFDGPRCFCRC